MDNQLIVSFWLNQSKKNQYDELPIYMRVRLNKKYFLKSTGIFIPSKYWDSHSMKVKGSSNESIMINSQLETLKIRVFQIFNQYSILGIPFNVYNIKNALEGRDKHQISLFDAYTEHLSEMEKLAEKEYVRSTINKYKNTRDRLKEFLKNHFSRGDIKLHELDSNFMSQFEIFLRDRYNNSTTTCYKHYQRFTRVIRRSIEKRYLDRYPFPEYKIKMPKKQIVYLTQAELDRIENTDFEVNRLNIIRDIFVFCCYTGLAYTEVESLSKQSITLGVDRELWLNIVRKKTSRSYQIPLLQKPIKILNKYENNPRCIQKDRLLHVPSNVKYNAYLKEIAHIARINRVC